jgi:uncharacterized membrane protein YgcG
MRKVLILTLLLLLAVSTTAWASPADPQYVIDGQGLLTVEEIGQLEAILGNATVETGTPFYLVTVPPYTMNEASLRAAGFTPPADCVILTRQREEGVYYYELFTYGRPNAAITDAEANRILDHSSVYDALKAGQWVEGVRAFTDRTVTACTGDLRIPLSRVLPVAFLLGALSAGIAAAVVVLRYKMKLRPTNYPLEHYTSLSLTTENDRFLGSFVTRRKIESSSGGGGGRSGGGGSRGRR